MHLVEAVEALAEAQAVLLVVEMVETHQHLVQQTLVAVAEDLQVLLVQVVVGLVQ
jgi:hypothetical protein